MLGSDYHIQGEPNNHSRHYHIPFTILVGGTLGAAPTQPQSIVGVL